MEWNGNVSTGSNGLTPRTSAALLARKTRGKEQMAPIQRVLLHDERAMLVQQARSRSNQRPFQQTQTSRADRAGRNRIPGRQHGYQNRRRQVDLRGLRRTALRVLCRARALALVRLPVVAAAGRAVVVRYGLRGTVIMPGHRIMVMRGDQVVVAPMGARGQRRSSAVRACRTTKPRRAAAAQLHAHRHEDGDQGAEWGAGEHGRSKSIPAMSSHGSAGFGKGTGSYRPPWDT